MCARVLASTRLVHYRAQKTHLSPGTTSHAFDRCFLANPTFLCSIEVLHLLFANASKQEPPLSPIRPDANFDEDLALGDRHHQVPHDYSAKVQY